MSILISLSSLRRAVFLAAALGALGGTALVLCAAFFSAGKLILLPYAVFVIATAVVLKSSRVKPYLARFAVGLLAFLFAMAALYTYLAASVADGISPAGHGGRLLLLLPIGAAIQAVVAAISE